MLDNFYDVRETKNSFVTLDHAPNESTTYTTINIFPAGSLVSNLDSVYLEISKAPLGIPLIVSFK